MAFVTTWTIQDMKRDTSTGAVDTAYWELKVSVDTHTDCVASYGDKLRLTPDATADDFIAYDNLTEATVLGWVYDSLASENETADEAKARLEADRQSKVTNQINAKTSTSTGVPW